MTKLDAALAAKLCAEAMEDAPPLVQCEAFDGMSNTRCAYVANHNGDHLFSRHDASDEIRLKLLRDNRDRNEPLLRALAEQLMAALEALTRLRSDEATMKLSRMLGLGDPVRPDIHASVCRQRDAALREVERMRAVYAHAIEWHRVRVPGMQQHERFVPTGDALWDAIDTALSQDKDRP